MHNTTKKLLLNSHEFDTKKFAKALGDLNLLAQKAQPW